MTRHVEWDRTQINRIFWGLIFIHFHINVNQLDLLPNFVGWILFYMAIEGLTVRVPEYNRLKYLAAVFAVLGLIEQVQTLMGVGVDYTFLSVVWAVLVGAANAYFDYRLFGCLMDSAVYYGLHMKADSLKNVRTARLVCNVLITACTPMMLRAAALLTVVGVIGMVIAVWACVTVRGLWKELGEYREQL